MKHGVLFNCLGTTERTSFLKKHYFRVVKDNFYQLKTIFCLLLVADSFLLVNHYLLG